MNLSPVAIDASYAVCRRLSRRAKSNFRAAFLLLPGAKRRAMEALYAFMRHTDDLADDPEPAHGRREALLRWRAALEHALIGHFGDGPGCEVLPALADTVRRYHVPPEHLRAVIDGVEMDLACQRYETFDELKQYCRRVASAVGLACIHVWGFRGEQAFQPAEQCGIAMQLTNILRDLAEDARANRVYLPLEDLRRCGYSVDDLKSGVADDRFGRLVALEVERAEQLYRDAAALTPWLEPDGQRIFGMMTATYRALLRKIARRPADVLKRRVCLSRPKKLQIAARWMLLPAA